MTKFSTYFGCDNMANITIGGTNIHFFVVVVFGEARQSYIYFFGYTCIFRQCMYVKCVNGLALTVTRTHTHTHTGKAHHTHSYTLQTFSSYFLVFYHIAANHNHIRKQNHKNIVRSIIQSPFLSSSHSHSNHCSLKRLRPAVFSE